MKEYTNLNKLIGSYFDQDCFHSAPTIEAIIEQYKEDEPENVPNTIGDIYRLLKDCKSESDVSKYIFSNGCYYNPLIEFGSHREWLIYLCELLKK